MTTVSNKKIFLNGIYSDATVKVAANTTLAAGTVLGVNASGEIVAYSTDLDSGYVPASGGDPAIEAFKAEPTYILAETLTNDTGSAKSFAMARVFDGGEVDAAMITFVKTADASDELVLAAMKNNGFILCNVNQLS